MQHSRLIYLFDRYISKTCSEAERRELAEIITSSQHDEPIKNLLEQAWANVAPGQDMPTEKADYILQSIFQQGNIDKKDIPVRRIFNWLKVAAAAAIILLLGTSGWFLFFNKGQKEIAKTDNSNPYKNDVAPGGNKAVLTLADGSTILLDSAQNGTLTRQGNTKVLKLDNGQLAYNASGNATEVLYNTISTPRGGQYQITLADGSKIWLNAASSIRFPAAFAGSERRVEITGEAYFEVAPLSPKGRQKMPFIVHVNSPSGDGGMTVEVLGTHFNINSYTDETSIKTTLLEGAIKITKGNTVQMLSPGQQAQLNSAGQISLNKNVDVDEIVAWKNGWFNFAIVDIENIMRQISRWYDVEVTYEGKISKETFSGIFSRYSNVSEVLKIMEQAGIKFTIEGNPPAGRAGKIIVLQ